MADQSVPSAEPSCLTAEMPTSEEFKILNEELLPTYATAYNALSILEVLKNGHHLDWEVKEEGGQKKLVPCVQDKDGNKVDYPVLNRQYSGAGNLMTIILPFMSVRTFALTPQKIARSSQRLNDEEGMPLTLKADCRQEIGIEAFPVTGDEPDTSVVYNELFELNTIRAARALIKASGPDFDQFKGSAETLSTLIQDKDWSKIYAWPPPPKTVEGADGVSREVKTVTCRASLFQSRKHADTNMDPEELHLPKDQRSAAPTEFSAYSEEDKQLVRDTLKKAGGLRKFTPIQVVMPDNTIGSSAWLRNNNVSAVVMGIGNINFGGRGGAVFVRKCFKIIVYRNGPQRETSALPVFNAAEFVKSKMGKRPSSETHSSIKAPDTTTDEEDDPRPAKVQKTSALSKLDEVKKKLATKRQRK